MALPDLDALITEAERTYLAAQRDAGQADGEVPDRIELLRAAVAVADRLRGLADDLVEDHVEQARLHGRSWAEVGAVLGVTRQAAEQRYRAPHYDPAAFADEICAAVAHMRETARRHHNGFIGTEHMLCGLLAEDNSAVRLLSSLDIPADSVRQRVQRSLTVGASQAAKRIAWTPYTRRVLATAHELAAQDDSRIGCDHLLLGLAALGRGTAASALAEVSAGHPALVRVRAR